MIDKDHMHDHSGFYYWTFKARPHEAISCAQFLSNSFIRKLSLWFQHKKLKSMMQIVS